MAFAAGVTLLSGSDCRSDFGVVGARRTLVQTLQEAARTHSGGQSKARLRKMLLAAEMGLTVVLLIGAGLLLKSYRSLRTVNMGCTTQNVLTMRISLPEARYKLADEA